ncbi:hypothetical protein [Hyphomonas sp. UBA4494]|jgi:hypothetical protein|uniref:hypothetical protein n=1 Tax=Hyphomonas sp. UBA4494 TaxID=1946631 RepID=UPI0025BB6113|nr:hypothetical protein [Hyphomonas sp. UBA4494]
MNPCAMLPPGFVALVLTLGFAGIVALMVAIVAIRDRSDFDRENQKLRAENDTLRARCSGIETKGA